MRHGNLIKLIVLSVVAFTFSACLKDNDPVEIRVARVAFLNAVPESDGVDIGLDQNQVNNPWSNNPDFAYGDTLGYVNAFPGQRWVRVFASERDPYEQPLIDGTINLTPGESYTIYVVGHEELGLVATTDNLSTPASGKAKVRFVNLSPDAPSLSLGINGEGTNISSDKDFKEYSDFVEVDAGETFDFEITLHASGEIAHSFSMGLHEGGFYTIWAKGLFDNSLPNAPFEHGVMDYRTAPITEE